MSRVQLAINVDDLDASIDFYSTLFATEPAKVRPGYANFAVAEPPLKLVLIENPGRGGSLNHLGVEVEDVETVDAIQARLAQDGLASVDERGSVCCYAQQDKFWVQDTPDGESWEVYTVLADSVAAGGPAAGTGCTCGDATPGASHDPVVLTQFNLTTPVRLRPPSDRMRTKPPKRITNKDRARAVELYQSGLSLNAVAREIGVSRHVVAAAVERAGIALRARYNHDSQRKHKA